MTYEAIGSVGWSKEDLTNSLEEFLQVYSWLPF